MTKYRVSSALMTPPETIRQRNIPTVKAKKDHDTFLNRKQTNPSGRESDTPVSMVSLAEEGTSSDPESRVKRKLELESPKEPEQLQIPKKRKPMELNLIPPPKPQTETSMDLMRKYGIEEFEMEYTESDYDELINYKLYMDNMRPLLLEYAPKLHSRKRVNLLAALWKEFAASNPKKKKPLSTSVLDFKPADEAKEAEVEEEEDGGDDNEAKGESLEVDVKVQEEEKEEEVKEKKGGKDASTSKAENVRRSERQQSNTKKDEVSGGIADHSPKSLPRKFNVNRKNGKGETPLQLACFKNDITKVRELLNKPDIDVNARDNAGWTPLHEACIRGHTASVKELLKFASGKRMVTSTESRGMQTLDFLAAPSECGNTPLHDAVFNNHIEVVKLLVEAGGSILLTAKNKAGFTPFGMALTEVMKEAMLGQRSEVSRLPAVEYENRTDVASKTIHPSRGGTIQLPHHGISLCIPALALQKECEITLKVLPHPSSVLFAENEATVSPGVVCEPSGTTFERPLKLVIPHCALLTDPSKVKVTMHFTHGNAKVTKKELSSTGSPRCIVRANDLEVYITHFSICEMFMVIADSFIGKRVASTPYLPKSMSRLQPQYCHLRLFNDTPGLGDLIEEEEKKLNYRKMAPKQKMFVHWDKGELKIICEVKGGYVPENERMKTVSLDDIYRLDQNLFHFSVKATGDADVHFKFNFYPHCDEGHAFRANFSGITEASLGSTNSTSPRSSTSTLVDTPPQGASAAVCVVSSSTAREVSDEMPNDLAKHVPSYAYYKFSRKLGTKRNHAGNILRKHLNDYEQATRECIAIWMDKSTRCVADLHEVLRAAELGDLIKHCN